MAEEPIMQHHQAFGRDISNFDAASSLGSSKPGAALKKKSKSGAGAIPIFHDQPSASSQQHHPPLPPLDAQKGRREHERVMAQQQQQQQQQQLLAMREEVAKLRALTAELQHGALQQAAQEQALQSDRAAAEASRRVQQLEAQLSELRGRAAPAPEEEKEEGAGGLLGEVSSLALDCLLSSLSLSPCSCSALLQPLLLRLAHAAQAPHLHPHRYRELLARMEEQRLDLHDPSGNSSGTAGGGLEVMRGEEEGATEDMCVAEAAPTEEEEARLVLLTPNSSSHPPASPPSSNPIEGEALAMDVSSSPHHGHDAAPSCSHSPPGLLLGPAQEQQQHDEEEQEASAALAPPSAAAASSPGGVVLLGSPPPLLSLGLAGLSLASPAPPPPPPPLAASPEEEGGAAAAGADDDAMTTTMSAAAASLTSPPALPDMDEHQPPPPPSGSSSPPEPLATPMPMLLDQEQQDAAGSSSSSQSKSGSRRRQKHSHHQQGGNRRRSMRLLQMQPPQHDEEEEQQPPMVLASLSEMEEEEEGDDNHHEGGSSSSQQQQPMDVVGQGPGMLLLDAPPPPAPPAAAPEGAEKEEVAAGARAKKKPALSRRRGRRSGMFLVKDLRDQLLPPMDDDEDEEAKPAAMAQDDNNEKEEEEEAGGSSMWLGGVMHWDGLSDQPTSPPTMTTMMIATDHQQQQQQQHRHDETQASSSHEGEEEEEEEEEDAAAVPPSPPRAAVLEVVDPLRLVPPLSAPPPAGPWCVPAASACPLLSHLQHPQQQSVTARLFSLALSLVLPPSSSCARPLPPAVLSLLLAAVHASDLSARLNSSSSSQGPGQQQQPPRAASGSRGVRFCDEDFSAIDTPIDLRVGSEQGVESLLAALVAVLEAEHTLTLPPQAQQQQQEEEGGAGVVWVLGQLLAALQLLALPQHVKSVSAVLGGAPLSRLCSLYLHQWAPLLLLPPADHTNTTALAPVGRPLVRRVLQLSSCLVRFHLRRLFSAPPVRFTTPGLQAELDRVSGHPHTDRNLCRSKVHELLVSDETPVWLQQAVEGGAWGSVVSHAAMHTQLGAEEEEELRPEALLPPAHQPVVEGGPGGRGGGHSQAALEAVTQHVARLQAVLLLCESRRFLHSLLTDPAVEAAVSQAGGYQQLESAARAMHRFVTGYEAEEEVHLTAFRDMAGLKRRLQQSQDQCKALALAVQQAAQQLLAQYKPRRGGPPRTLCRDVQALVTHALRDEGTYPTIHTEQQQAHHHT